MSRFVLLREFPPDLDIEQVPDDDYINRPGSSLEQKPFRVRTDANGFILSGNEISGDCDHVIASGDSVCETLYIDEDKRIGSVLSRLLSRSSVHPIEVLNGGVSGNHLLHIINTMMNKVVPLHPSGVIFLGGVVDRIAAGSDMSYWSKSPEVCTIVQKRKGMPAPVGSLRRVIDFSDLRRLLGLLVEICATFGIPLVFLTVPVPGSQAGEYCDLLRKSNDVIRTICVGKNLPFVELENLFGDSLAYTYDEVHLNEAGSALVAEAIFSSGILKWK